MRIQASFQASFQAWSCRHLLIILLWVFVSGSAIARVTPMTAPEHLDSAGFQDVLAKVADNIYIAGQPSPGALQALRDKGVRTVINLRTEQEMQNRQAVPFDEAAKLSELGMAYVHIPLGGPDTPYTPQAVTRLAEVLENSEGDVLLHCTVAWRASHLWAAYLVKEHNFTVSDAVKLGKAINMGGYPFAEFLDRAVTLEPPVGS